MKSKIINNSGIVVLSVFDGMSCGQLALERAGIKVKTYYASEINKYAIKVTMHNFPNTVQLGSVTDVRVKDLPEIPDLLIGGSPCQGFSRAGKGLNFDDPRSKLFFEYVRLWNELKEINPDAKFLLENVRMLKEWENIISKFMGVNPVLINSALVSAQNRQRLYWNNFNIQKYGLFDHTHNVISQPKDRKIFLKDILQNDVDEKYFLSEKTINTIKKHGAFDRINGDKSLTLLKGYAKMAGRDQTYISDDIIVHNTQPRSDDPKKGGTGHLSRNDGKTYCLDTGNTNAVELLKVNGMGKKQNIKACALKAGALKAGANSINPRSAGTNLVQFKETPKWDSSGKGHVSQDMRAYYEDGKAPSLGVGNSMSKPKVVLNTNQQKKFNQNVNTDKANAVTTAIGRAGSSSEYMDSVSKIAKLTSRIRRLTPIECCRLQTVPDDYFHDSNGVQIISDSRIYECLGNGWTVEVIVHLLNFFKQHINPAQPERKQAIKKFSEKIINPAGF